MPKYSDYGKLHDRLVRKAVRKRHPIHAVFELTYRCNFSCRHCYIPYTEVDREKSSDSQPSCPGVSHGAKEIGTKEVFKILDELALNGCFNVGFTGGEPLVRRDIFDILEYSKKKGFNIILLTNGSLITPAKAAKLKRLALNKIDISFHSFREEQFDWFVRTPGAYKKVIKAIELVSVIGTPFYFKTAAMTINKDDMVKIRRLAVEKYGARFRWVPWLTPRWDGTKDNLEFRLEPKAVVEIKKAISDDAEAEYEKVSPLQKRGAPTKRKSPGRRKIVNSVFNCNAGRTDVVINPYGEMKLCMDLPEPKYSILKGNFAEGWRMLGDYAEGMAPGPTYRCHECDLFRFCDVCPARSYLECGDLNACPPYHRKLAEFTKELLEKDIHYDFQKAKVESRR
ncbi:MAG: radical SAM protein [Candidatus Omnitrophica bacterium]|nr:radical SAM protein [Candidatus Omnitrophota bacterium]